MRKAAETKWRGGLRVAGRDCPEQDRRLELGAGDAGLSGSLWVGHPRLQAPFPAGGQDLCGTGWRAPPSVQAAEN